MPETNIYFPEIYIRMQVLNVILLTWTPPRTDKSKVALSSYIQY